MGNPTILATWAVIAAVLPMAFVSGMMGPYMRPIPIGSSAAMLFSLMVAFVVTPWAALKVLRGHAAARPTRRGIRRRPADRRGRGGRGGAWPIHSSPGSTSRIMRPLLDASQLALGFLAVVAGLTVGSMGLVGIGAVKVKMLPFDNKSEFQVILNMPRGSHARADDRRDSRNGCGGAHRTRGARL